MKVLALFLLFLLSQGLAYAHGISADAQQRMLEGGYLQYLFLGAEHMVTGYDHLLFIFGVVFFLKRFREVVKFITAFTLGHSITLIFATIYKIHANYFLVDAVIALSVCYKGFENVGGFRQLLKMEPPNLLFMVFGFGLIHGFGLSTRLQKLPLGDGGLIMRILSFNVGVEIGQILALTVIIFLLAQWRRMPSFLRFSTASNTGLILAGAFLFLMQMHGYLHVKMPDEFGFPGDNHHHEHERLISRAHRLSWPDDSPEPLSDEQAIAKATFDVALIVQRNEHVGGRYLDEGWLKVPDQNKKIVKKDKNHCVVSFENHEDGKTMYVLLRSKGGFLKANFNGRFHEI